MRICALICSLAAALLVSAPAQAELTFVTWNIDGGQKTPSALRFNAAAMAAIVGPVDIVIVQEVISEDQVDAIAEGLGLAHWAISDFAPPVSITGFWAQSLEVGIISRLPILSAAEWDTTGPHPHGDSYLPRVSNPDIAAEELAIAVGAGENPPSRGFLRAELGGGWTVYAVHWKSSRGESCNVRDAAFARERENQAAGLANDVASEVARGQTVVVGGDLNTQAPGTVLRVGTNLDLDCTPTSTCDGVCGAGGVDGYDDSIQTLLSADNSGQLLSTAVPATYVGGTFADFAIDHLAAFGPRAASFGEAETPDVVGDNFEGSDHRPVFARTTEGPTEVTETERERLERLISEMGIRLLELEREQGETE